MAFYDEYINSATGLTVVSAQEFVDAAVGSTFERVDGTIFTKNSQGYFDITGNRGEDNITRIEANEVDIANLQAGVDSIDSSNFTTLSTLKILNSSGSTLKTIHGSGV